MQEVYSLYSIDRLEYFDNPVGELRYSDVQKFRIVQYMTILRGFSDENLNLKIIQTSSRSV